MFVCYFLCIDDFVNSNIDTAVNFYCALYWYFRRQIWIQFYSKFCTN
jgi:hypothetical protein